MIDYQFEDSLINKIIETKENTIIIGVDEVGRGALAGPVFAAAVWIKNRNILGLNDSKKLSPKKREELSEVIKLNSCFAISSASVEEIDNINILEASKLAMQRAIEQIIKELPYNPSLVIIDGNQTLKMYLNIHCIVNGDSLCPSIAAASIIAKVYRDRLMSELSKDYHQYQWCKNKGYGTNSHINALMNFGPCIHHRKSFSPVKEAAKVIHEL